MTETSERIIGVLIKDPNTSGQQTFPVLQDSTLSIGRLPDNDIYLADPTVRRHHCRLSVEEGQVHLVAIEYSHTWVNGTQVSEISEGCRLKFGDVIAVGKSVFHFEPAETPRGEDTAPQYGEA
jgi:pSer/pThr/pTyr-binding forkhead associated (FHA) protein